MQDTDRSRITRDLHQVPVGRFRVLLGRVFSRSSLKVLGYLIACCCTVVVLVKAVRYLWQHLH